MKKIVFLLLILFAGASVYACDCHLTGSIDSSVTSLVYGAPLVHWTDGGHGGRCVHNAWVGISCPGSGKITCFLDSCSCCGTKPCPDSPDCDPFICPITGCNAVLGCLVHGTVDMTGHNQHCSAHLISGGSCETYYCGDSCPNSSNHGLSCPLGPECIRDECPLCGKFGCVVHGTYDGSFHNQYCSDSTCGADYCGESCPFPHDGGGDGGGGDGGDGGGGDGGGGDGGGDPDSDGEVNKDTTNKKLDTIISKVDETNTTLKDIETDVTSIKDETVKINDSLTTITEKITETNTILESLSSSLDDLNNKQGETNDILNGLSDLTAEQNDIIETGFKGIEDTIKDVFSADPLQVPSLDGIEHKEFSSSVEFEELPTDSKIKTAVRDSAARSYVSGELEEYLSLSNEDFYLEFPLMWAGAEENPRLYFSNYSELILLIRNFLKIVVYVIGGIWWVQIILKAY